MLRSVGRVEVWYGIPMAVLTFMLVVGPVGDGGSVASLWLVMAVPSRGREMPGLLGSIATGALVVAVLGWVGASLVDLQMDPGLAAGVGIAVGGGLGALAWLLTVDETATPGRETMAVEMADDRNGPAPQPADLFAASPDPIVFFAGDPPVVRAVNPAFEATFGRPADSVEGSPLRETLAVDAPDDVVTAARSGDTDTVVECETEDGPQPMRVRAVANDGSTGYVLFTPVDGPRSNPGE